MLEFFLNGYIKRENVKQKFPFIAAGIGIVFVLILQLSGATSDGTGFKIPLLTMLLMSELGAIVTALGAYFGLMMWKTERNNMALLMTSGACLLLCVALAVLGFGLWEHASAL